MFVLWYSLRVDCAHLKLFRLDDVKRMWDWIPSRFCLSNRIPRYVYSCLCLTSRLTNVHQSPDTSRRGTYALSLVTASFQAYGRHPPISTIDSMSMHNHQSWRCLSTISRIVFAFFIRPIPDLLFKYISSRICAPSIHFNPQSSSISSSPVQLSSPPSIYPSYYYPKLRSRLVPPNHFTIFSLSISSLSVQHQPVLFVCVSSPMDFFPC